MRVVVGVVEPQIDVAGKVEFGYEIVRSVVGGGYVVIVLEVEVEIEVWPYAVVDLVLRKLASQIQAHGFLLWLPPALASSSQAQTSLCH